MNVIEDAADERALEEAGPLEVSAAQIRPVEAHEVEAGAGTIGAARENVVREHGLIGWGRHPVSLAAPWDHAGPTVCRMSTGPHRGGGPRR